MTYETIVTIINLLTTTIRPPYQELVLIDQLNRAFSFDHNIFLLHTSADINRFINSAKTSYSTPESLYTFDSIDDNITGFQTHKQIQGKNKLLIVVPKSSNFKCNLKLLTFVKNVQLFNVNIKIGVFFTNLTLSDDIQNFFEWCWSHRIINIFVAFYSKNEVTSASNSEPILNIFNFKPFETFITNLTGSKFIHRIFPNKKLNFQQHKIRLAVIDDESLIQYSSTVPFIGGPDEKMWTAVFSVLNASYSIFWVKEKMEPIETLNNGTIDIHGDLYEMAEQRPVTIYPMIIEIISMVVPKSLPYPALQAYLHAIGSDSFFGYFFMLTLTVMFLLTICRYIKRKKIMFFECVADVFNLLMNDNFTINYQQLTRGEVFLIIPLTIAGFVIVNGFLSNLKSHLTRPILQPQIGTLDTLHQSLLPVSAPNDFWLRRVTNLLNNLSRYDDWGKKMIINNGTDVMPKIKAETAFSFFEYESTAKLICKHRKYHLTKIQLQWIWFSYNVRHDFPFTERLNEVIQWVRTSGLYDKWWRDVSEEKVFIKIETDSHVDSQPELTFVIYGWLAGFIVLIIEIYWEKIRHSILGCKVFTTKILTVE